jgi:subtilisin family serine protease
MRKVSFAIPPKASCSLASMLARKEKQLRPAAACKAAGFQATDKERIHETDVASVLIETEDLAAVESSMSSRPAERLDKLTNYFVSAQVSTDTLAKLVANPKVQRVQAKKKSVPHLDLVLPEIMAAAPTGARRVVEDGRGALIGIVDSGFDLAHPMFRDVANNLRVDGLLDQSDGREYNTAALQKAWAGGTGPGADANGHGTHVASIAGGSRFQNRFEGVAPGARFLLVKTDFQNTDKAVSWIFDQAQGKPCVINMSLGHHFGSHDGTDAEERLHRALTGPGKIIVVSAGNEQERRLHVGSRFHPAQSEEVVFDVLRQPEDDPFVVITLWYSDADQFEFELITPSGQSLPVPAIGTTDNYQSAMVDLELARKPYAWSNSIQTQITLGFRSTVPDLFLSGWKLKFNCQRAVLGRLDGWFNNSGFAVFRPNLMVEEHRTVGLPATGASCITVASYVSRNSWNSDLGAMNDSRSVLGRISSFSSLGPTRDDRWKPDIAAPGQYVTAALADRSELARWDERALVSQRLLTIEGTSMSAPVITGVVALMLQKKPTLSVDDARQVLAQTARHDGHTGPGTWNPAYGNGKVDSAAALAAL